MTLDSFSTYALHLQRYMLNFNADVMCDRTLTFGLFVIPAWLIDLLCVNQNVFFIIDYFKPSCFG